MAFKKNAEIVYKTITLLLDIEENSPRDFYDVISWLQDIYQEINSSIGQSTLMGSQAIKSSSSVENVVSPHDFLALKFRDPELGRRIIITLMEIEARDRCVIGSVFEMVKGISGRSGIMRKDVQYAEIVPFPK
ncbi:hypothetical protein MTBBW1_1020034 [Desulfamplus magnetovallimortis]|uniref:Uncharacterized protein n=1 Tax=Desulfamplus magnetovallimortis TaxID=1246637 RepID=A0A1W1H4V1_9BACT|nr:hypothetical protein [Desulfamplus magnetovallimortis]SLM27510.1 hypothetical protein MTBBW1_1020034 [Desulfamplus magnetovallimortis]